MNVTLSLAQHTLLPAAICRRLFEMAGCCHDRLCGRALMERRIFGIENEYDV